jgi:hypothetical protein
MHPGNVQGRRWQWCVRGLPGRHLFYPVCRNVWLRIMPCKLRIECEECNLLLRPWLYRTKWRCMCRLHGRQVQIQSGLRSMRCLPSKLIICRSEHIIRCLCLSGRIFGAKRRSVRGMHPRHVQGRCWQWCVRGLPSRHLFYPVCRIVWLHNMPCKLRFECEECNLLLRHRLHRTKWRCMCRLHGGQIQIQ